MLKVLVAGFGPFPGAPRNPSGDLALALGRMRRPGLAGVKIHAHVFPTIYAAVANELPRLLAKHDPDAVLLFGLAGRSDRVRIETRAVNAASLIHPDAARSVPRSRKLYPKAPAELFVRPEVRRLIAAARSTSVAGYVMQTWDEIGRQKLSYAGIPILFGYEREIEGDLLSFDEVGIGGGSAVTASAYVVRLGEDGLHGIQLTPFAAEDQGLLEDRITYNTHVAADVGLADEHPFCMARLTSFTDAAILA